ncbi:MAG: metal-binding protein [Candidatus Bipolaricaulota bacterium]|nr:metal-binding protein [Candidatus Bipolaricaulota bacterium]
MGTLPAWVLAGAALGAGRGSLIWFSGAYVGASLFLSPDLDLATSRAARRWRGARILWRPYAALFRHRGISHSPFLGPLTRLVYLGLLGGIGWAILHRLAGVPFPRAFPTDSLIPVLAGLYLPQLLHVALDRLVSTEKRSR